MTCIYLNELGMGLLWRQVLMKGIWETGVPSVPAVLLEVLSARHFAVPRVTACRADTLGQRGRGPPCLGSCFSPASPNLVPSASLSLCTPRPTGPVESEVGCGHHEQGRRNDTETAKLTHSLSFHFMFMGEKGKVFKHKRISYSSDSKKKNVSQVASSFGHQIALLTAFLIKTSKEER